MKRPDAKGVYVRVSRKFAILVCVVGDAEHVAAELEGTLHFSSTFLRRGT